MAGIGRDWPGLGRVLVGFWQGLAGFWSGLGRVLAKFWSGFRRVLAGIGLEIRRPALLVCFVVFCVVGFWSVGLHITADVLTPHQVIVSKYQTRIGGTGRRPLNINPP